MSVYGYFSPALLKDNSRFYILASTVLLSIAVVSWLRISIAGDRLFYIRTEQVFGLLCLLYWYVAMIISPLGYVIGKQRMKHVEFARRAIGVSAAYFAALHTVVALWGQFGGLGQIGQLPSLFRWSLLGGLAALVVLLLMAATSFDKVISLMTFRRWKWLHRLVYLGGVLALLHVWSVGTHLAYSGVQIAAFAALVVLSGLEAFRLVTLFTRRVQEYSGKISFTVLFVVLWVIWIEALWSVPLWIDNYHTSRHSGHDHSLEVEVEP